MCWSVSYLQLATLILAGALDEEEGENDEENKERECRLEDEDEARHVDTAAALLRCLAHVTTAATSRHALPPTTLGRMGHDSKKSV